MPKTAHWALTSAAFLVGVGVGAWLTRPREAPRLRSYDRELANEAQAAAWRARGLRGELERRHGKGEQGGSTA